MTSFSLVGALEFRDIVAGLQPHSAGASLGVFETPITPFAGGYYNRPPSRSRSPASRGDAERDPWDEALSGVPLNDRTSPPISNRQSLVETPLVLSALHSDDGGDDDDESHSTVPRIEHIPATPRQAQHNLAPSPTIENSKLPKRAFVRHAAIRSFEILFPTLNNFRVKGILVRLASIFAAPAVFCLTLTLPVVVTSYGSDMASQDDKSPRSQLQTAEGRLIDYDGEAEGIERTLIAEEEVQEDMHDHLRFNKWLMVTQCILAPLFCAKVLFGESTI
jgi:solute carrier family 24 (sodium/potassium/calcium exchanger), member 6